MIKRGALRGSKTREKNEEWICIWYPFPDEEDTGLCFDMPCSDLDDAVLLLLDLREAEAKPIGDL